MNSKLTLSLDASVIKKAKEYSKSTNTSLSKIVERHLTTLLDSQKSSKKKSIKPTPITNSLLGVLNTAKVNINDARFDHLADKYL